MEVLEHRFATIGARVKIPAGPRRGTPAIDVGDDRLRVDEWAVLRDEPISRGQGSAARPRAQVAMNTEHRAEAMRHVAFLD